MSTIDYQLVLQFHEGAMVEFDALIELEEALISELGQSADVDGHDIGASQINIFIITGSPTETFDKCFKVLERSEYFLAGLKAAFRPIEGSRYTVLYPPNSSEFVVS